MDTPKRYGGGKVRFWMFDVGGQRGERKKWLPVSMCLDYSGKGKYHNKEIIKLTHSEQLTRILVLHCLMVEDLSREFSLCAALWMRTDYENCHFILPNG